MDEKGVSTDTNKDNFDKQKLVLNFEPIDLMHNNSLSDVIIVNAQPDLSRLNLESVSGSSLKRVCQSTELESFIKETLILAKNKNANLVVFPELCVPNEYHNLFSEWAKANNNSILFAGSDYFHENGRFYNRASIFYNDKQYYTEKFRPSPLEIDISCRDKHQFYLRNSPIGNLGIVICSDIFQDGCDEYETGQDLIAELKKNKLDILVVIAYQDKPNEHLNIINTLIEGTSDRMLCIYCNPYGKKAMGRSAILAKDYSEGHENSIYRKLVQKDGLSANQIEMPSSGGALFAKYKISKAPPIVGNRDPARILFPVKEIYEYISGEFVLKQITPDATPSHPKKPTCPTLHNLPDINEFFAGRKEFLEKIHNHFQTEKKPLRLTISGFGGVGKTQTAIAYADRYKNDYYDILWVDAEGSIERYYRDFAQSKGLPSDEKVGWSVVLNAVKNWFDKNPRFLLIFDNVEDFDKLSGCLPRENGHVLITTRKSNSPFGKLEVLDEFKREEALEFLKERLGRDEGENAANLAEQLGYLPLALAQAAAYIFVNKSRVNCEAYLKLLDDEGLEMFNKDDAKEYRYKATVNVTWQISIDKIETKGAKQLFNLCAYMAPDNIPLSLFIEGQDQLPKELQEALGNKLGLIEVVSELTRYSLMAEKDGLLSIHRLVQEVVRKKLKKDKETQWLSCCLDMAMNVFKYKYGDPKSMEAFKRNAQHILAIAGYAESVFEDNVKYQVIIGWLYNIAGFGYLHSGQYDEAFAWYQKDLNIREIVLGKDHPSAASTYNNIALVYKNQGKYDEALALYQKALDIVENVLGKDHPYTATTYNNIALVYDNQGKYDEALAWYQKALEIREIVLGKDHPDTAEVYNNIAIVYNNQGKYDEALVLYEKALEIDENVLGKDHPSTATTYNNIAAVFCSQGKYDEALALYQKALDIVENVLGKDHPYTATTYNNIAGVLDNQGKYDETLAWYQKALDIYERVLGKDHPYTATTYNNIAGVYKNQGKYDEALAWYKKALDIVENVLGKDHPSTATTYNDIAGVLDDQGKYDEALAWYKKALDIVENVLGKDHPSAATTYNNIALVYNNQGKYDEALALYQKALEIREKILGKDHPYTATTYNSIAGVLDNQGKYDEALALFEKALEIYEKVLSKDHPETATTYNNIAGVLDNQGKYDEALVLYEKALEIREKVLGKDHPDTAMMYNNIAGVYKNQGKYDEALSLYQKALEIKEKVLDKDHPSTATTYNNIAGVYKNQGKYDEALAWYEKALEIVEDVLGKDHPYAVSIYFSIAAVYDELGRREEAEEWRKKAAGEKLM